MNCNLKAPASSPSAKPSPISTQPPHSPSSSQRTFAYDSKHRTTEFDITYSCSIVSGPQSLTEVSMRVPRPALSLHLSLWRITFSLIMSLAFLAGQAVGGKSPTISSPPTSGAVGTSVTISGSNFGSSQGSSTLTFNGVARARQAGRQAQSWQLSRQLPQPAPWSLSTSGTASNSVTFTVTPVISSLSPTPRCRWHDCGN